MFYFRHKLIDTVLHKIWQHAKNLHNKKGEIASSRKASTIKIFSFLYFFAFYIVRKTLSTRMSLIFKIQMRISVLEVRKELMKLRFYYHLRNWMWWDSMAKFTVSHSFGKNGWFCRMAISIRNLVIDCSILRIMSVQRKIKKDQYEIFGLNTF